MRSWKNLPAALLALLLIACIAAYFATGSEGGGPGAAPASAPAAGAQPSLMDERLLETAKRLAASADTADEQELAREALRLADHELDLAFATALREAAQFTPPAGSPLERLAARVAQLKARVAADQARVSQLAKDAVNADSAQSDLAKAQLELDQDELDDAQQDLARQGGDRHAAIERALQQHEAAQREPAQLPRLGAPVEAGTLWRQLQRWLSLGERNEQVLAASQDAAGRASALERQHQALEGNAQPANHPAGEEEDEEEDTAAIVARLRRLSDQKKTLAELGKRSQDLQQLAAAYKRWSADLAVRRRSALHLLLGSTAAAFGVLLAVILASMVIRRAWHLRADRKRLQQLRLAAGIGVQLTGAALIFLIVFGPPTQIGTLIGLATAGLTVALKDFIVAFFGWFILMGRNGIRVGDWVEINGVGGEVIEIGVLRTVLLEMGNWTSTGHPTGRRVAFVNSFAIEGHYFNFSTAGQWLWDQLELTLPSTADSYQLADQIRATVERETETEVRLAEQDWERVTRQYGVRPFPAKPAVELRPSAGGLIVLVRYITRAPQRFEVKARLLQVIVELFRSPAASGA
jgi:small-conductance mechanosensitive channel